MIQTLIFSQLTSAELYQFFTLIVNGIDDAEATKNKLKTERDALAVFLPKLKNALNKEEAYSLTKLIEELDNRRDIAIAGFYAHVNSLCMHPKATTQAAAQIMKEYLKTHGSGIAKLNYQIESAILTKIIDDCKTNTTLKTACTTLGVSDWLTEIETANTGFISKYQERSGAMGLKANEDSFYMLRKPAIETYQKLIDILESRYRTAIADAAATSTTLKKYIDSINAHITQYKQLIKTSHSRKKNTKEEVLN